ncbi:MAG: hypothetical protein KME17_03960 [Cyanosarcina radialis HA8281-LM2]|nr:hypothetical protein [Cyanosarcina radialis HA8281-LM2]
MVTKLYGWWEVGERYVLRTGCANVFVGLGFEVRSPELKPLLHYRLQPSPPGVQNPTA